MKKGMLITLLICAAVFALGVVMVIAGYRMGATDFDIDIINRKIHSFNSEEIKNGVVSVEPFTDMDLDIGNSNVNIIEGDEFKVEYSVYNDVPTIEVKNEKLIVIHKVKNGQFVFHLGLVEYENPTINIYIPKETKLGTININDNAGNLKIKSQSVGNLKMDVDEGIINLSDSEFGNIDIESNSGDIAISGIKADVMDMSVDYGNVRIDDTEMDKLKIDADAGNIKAESSRINDIDIKSDAGNVKLEIIGEKADYSIEASVDFGNLKIDGERQGSKVNMEGKSGKSIKVKSNAGNVDIEF